MNKLRTMNPEQAAALFRTVLQVLGGVVATWGWMSDAQWTTISAGLLTVATTVWGLYARRDTALITSAANVPAVEKVVAESAVAQAIPAANVVARLLAFLVILPVLAVALGACQTAGGVGGAISPVAGTTTALDARIARVSAELAQYCNLTRTALTVADLFVTKRAHERAIRQAQAAVAAACDAPPTDVVSALAAVTRAYQGVMLARQQG